jgi:hypothetical protein
MTLFPLFDLARSLSARGISLIPEPGGLKVKPKGSLKPEDVEAIRTHSKALLSAGSNPVEYWLRMGGWYVYRLTSTVYVAQGALYPGVEGSQLPSFSEWAQSLRERGIRLSQGPEDAVALSPLDAVEGPDVVAAGKWGLTLLHAVVPSIRSHTLAPPEPRPPSGSLSLRAKPQTNPQKP